ncbi:MAG TPA: EAL domain-containing protein [Burkholderiaceae bacterium]|nr:EAL domain-containing protein [Burkholderiaceae bacterium]
MRREDIESLFGPLEGLDLDHLLRQAGEAIVYVDDDWTVRYCNSIYLSNLGLSRGEVIGKTPFEYFPNFKRSIFYEVIERCRRERKPTAKIGYSTVLDRWLMARVFPVNDGMLLLANDASESVVRQYQLAQQVVKDPLTGIPNKLGLINDLESLFEQNHAFSLLVIGLDRFRSINDALGYAGGDMALLEVASRLQTETVPGEQLYRLNGDEFCVLQKQGAEGLHERAVALIDIAKQPLMLHGHRFVLGASAGCVVRDIECRDPEQMLKRAALALRHAKKTQRGGLVAYEPGLERSSQLRTELEGELRAAIEQHQLMLMLQPKGSLSEGTLAGAEALIRWAHPKRGIVSPAEFLPLAEDAGLMATIDQLVLKQALGHISTLYAMGIQVPVSINLSVQSLGDVCMVDRVREALRAANVPPNLLEIEIPEGALMQDVDVSAKVLGDLHRMGVRLSIDDFGTGYSSFAYLARFPVHTLKVDRSFVKEISTNDTSHKIVKSLVRLAHSLQLSVIAEGVEESADMEILKRIRCDMVQGYAYGRPMPFDKFVEFAREHHPDSETMRWFTV